MVEKLKLRFFTLPLVIVLLVFPFILTGQTTLNQGDVAVLGMNANANCPAYGYPNGTDILDLVFFLDIEPGTEIKITDNAYQRLAANPGQWGNNEGITRFTYNGPTTIPAGTVITFRYPNTYEVLSPAQYNDWSFTDVDGSNILFLNVAVGGDQLFIMQGATWNNGDPSNHNATYTGNVLFGWNSKDQWTPFSDNNADSGLHPDVEPCYYYNTASGNEPYSSYTGPSTATTKENWLARITDPANWTNWGSCANYQEPIETLEIIDFEFSGLPDEICAGDDAIVLPTLQSGIEGEWSGLGVSANEFNPAGLSGTIELTFTPVNDCLPDYVFEIEVIEAGIPVFNLSDEYCTGDTPENLPAFSDNGIEGSWNPSSINTNDPGGFTYTFSPNDGCNEEFILEVTILENAVPTFDLNDEYCIGETPQSLPTTSDNGFEGSWNPSSINTNDPGTFTYTFTPDDECSEEFVLEVTITENVIPTFDLDTAYCVGETPQPLPTTSNNGFEGSWNPSSINTNDPGTFTYTFTPDDDCSEAFVLAVTITENVIPTFDLDTAYCAGETPQSLPTTSDNGIEGSWNPSSINTSDPGTFTYTFTPDDDCSEEFVLEVTITENVASTFDLDTAYCVGQTPQSLPTTSDNGIEGSWNPSSINTNDPGTFTYTFTPDDDCSEAFVLEITITENVIPTFDLDTAYCAGETPQSLPTTSDNGFEGSWNPSSINTNDPGTFTYTFTPGMGQCAEELVLEITIHPLPDATASNGGPYCEGETINLSASGGIEYSWTGPNAFSSDDQNPIIPLASSFSSGEYTVTVTDENGCISTATTSVMVNALPSAMASSNSPICVGNDLELNGEGGTSYQWSGPDGFNSTEQNPLISNAGIQAAGNYQVTVTSDEGCNETVILAVEVNPLPTINISLIECDPGLSTYHVEFNTDGDDIILSEGVLTNLGGGNYEVSEIDIENNLTIEISFSSTNCSILFTIDAPDCDCPFIPAPISGGNSEICAGDDFPALIVITSMDYQVNWFSQSSGGDTLLLNSTSYEPNQAGTFYAEVYDPLTGCISTQRTAVSLIINPLPTINIIAIECSADLETYAVTFSTNAQDIQNSSGNLNDLGSGEYEVTEITEGDLLVLTLTLIPTFCVTTTEINSPNCDCPLIDAPVSDGDLMICEGDDLPLLSASVPPGLQINWYDSPFGGVLLQENSETYQPAEQGIFYAEAFDPDSECTSQERTAILLIINPLPSAELISSDCENEDFYRIEFESEATSIDINAGIIELIGGLQYLVSEIPVGTDLIVELFDLFTNCENTIIFPFELNCGEDCEDVTQPMVVGDSIFFICHGEGFPELEASVPPGFTINWYDNPFNGELLLGNSPVFTPSTAGNFFAEAYDTENDCYSETRTQFQITLEPELFITLVNFNCEADTYSILLQVTGDTMGRSFELLTAGELSFNPDGSITISEIPQGETSIIESIHLQTNCSQEFIFNSPDCDCPEIALPTGEQEYEICADEDFPAFELEVENGLTINWYADSTGGVPLLSNSLTFTPNQAGIFYAESVDTTTNCRSEGRVSVTLIVNPLPQAVINTTDCDDNEERYSATFMTDGNPANFWFTAGGIGQVVLNPDGSLTVANIPIGQNVTLIVINTATGCDNEYLIESPDCDCPDIPQPGGGGLSLVCVGDDFPVFEALADSDLIVNWYDAPANGNLLLGNSFNFVPPAEGSYYAETLDTTNNCVSLQRTLFEFQILPLPEIVQIPEIDCHDDSDTYFVVIQTNSTIIYEWILLSTGNLEFQSTDLIRISDIPITDTLILQAQYQDTGLCNTVFTIEPPNCDCPEIDPPTGNLLVEICAGEEIPTLELNVNPGLTINWYDAPAAGNLIQENSLNFTPATAGLYYAESFDPNTGCSSTVRTMVELRINPNPEVTLSSIDCDDTGEFYNVIFITDGNDEVFWTTIGGIGIITQPMDSLLFVSNISSENDLTILGINIVTGCEIRVTIEAPDCDCPDILLPDFQDSYEICEGEGLPLITIEVADDFRVDWYLESSGGEIIVSDATEFLPPGPGNWYFELTERSTECTSSVRGEITIEIIPLPQINLIEVICLEGGMVEAIFEISAATLEVLGGDFELSNNLLRVFNFQIREEIEIRLFNNNCSLIEFFTEENCPDCNPLAIIQITQPSCPGLENGIIRIIETLEFDSNVNISLNGEFLAIPDDFPFDILGLDAGSYELVFSDGNCTLTEFITLNYELNPVAEILTELTIVPAGSQINMEVSTNLSPEFIIWEPENLTNCTNCPSLDVQVNTDINISVFITDSIGCTATANLFIQTFEEIRVYIPNVFSPNDDGINDTFRPFFPSQFNGTIADFSIFNRWGDRVFQLSGIPADNEVIGWDGTFNGEPVNPAVFVYSLRIETPGGEAGIFTGEITILR